MPILLTCPDIARRTGYSRMQITRLAGLDQIPSERIITKGGQYRYELTPHLAEWIRVRRRRPPKITRLDSGGFILGCRAQKGPRQRNTAMILEEMKLFTKEIRSRVTEVQDQCPSNEEHEILRDTLHTCIMALIRCSEAMRKGH